MTVGLAGAAVDVGADSGAPPLGAAGIAARISDAKSSNGFPDMTLLLILSITRTFFRRLWIIKCCGSK